MRKRSAHIFTDFKLLRPDGRTQPGQQPIRSRFLHRPDGIFHDPCRQTAPASVGCTDNLSPAVTQQHRHAIRAQDRAHDTRLRGDTGVGLRRIKNSGRIHHPIAMHLRQPCRLGWELRFQQRPVAVHRSRLITNMQAKVKPPGAGNVAIRRHADATTAPGGKHADRARRGRPIGKNRRHRKIVKNNKCGVRRPTNSASVRQHDPGANKQIGHIARTISPPVAWLAGGGMQ